MKKLTCLGVTICSALIGMNLISVQANAAWKKDSKGWSYSFPGSNISAKGSKYKIDGKYYFFNEEGYMKTGWCQNSNGECYYAYNDGSLATDTTLYGYKFSKGGTMLENITDQQINYYRNLMYKNTNYNANDNKEIDCHVLTNTNYFGKTFNSIIIFDLYNSEFNEEFSVVIDRDKEKVYSTTNGGFYYEWSNKNYKVIVP